MSTVTQSPDLVGIKAAQQATWTSGDFSVVASRIVLVSELLAESADLRAGSHVLDVACGNGNAAIAAARSGARVVGVDYVHELLEDGRVRAAAEGLDVEFLYGDVEALPAESASFDAVLSVYGSMFAPDHHRAAAELLRVTRPGGTVALASWTPEGFIGQMFAVVSRYAPPPAGVRSPLLWGTEEHLDELFGHAVVAARSQVRECVWRFTSGEEFVAFFRRWYGPVLMAFARLDAATQELLARDLADLARAWDRNQDGGSLAIPATYLESVFTLR